MEFVAKVLHSACFSKSATHLHRGGSAKQWACVAHLASRPGTWRAHLCYCRLGLRLVSTPTPRRPVMPQKWWSQTRGMPLKLAPHDTVFLNRRPPSSLIGNPAIAHQWTTATGGIALWSWVNTSLPQLWTRNFAARAIPPTKKKRVLSASAINTNNGLMAKASLMVAAMRYKSDSMPNTATNIAKLITAGVWLSASCMMFPTKQRMRKVHRNCGSDQRHRSVQRHDSNLLEGLAGPSLIFWPCGMEMSRKLWGIRWAVQVCGGVDNGGYWVGWGGGSHYVFQIQRRILFGFSESHKRMT